MSHTRLSRALPRPALLASTLALLALSPLSARAQDIYYVPDGGWGWGWGGVVSYFLAWLGMTIAAGLLAAAFAWLVPLRARDAVFQTARREPGTSVGVGLLLAIALPLLGLALVLTVIGSPLGFAVWVAGLLLAFAGFVAAAWIVGRALATRSRAGQRMSHVGWLFVALAILCALSLIPVVGTFVWIAASVYGTGAIAVAAYRARQAQMEHERRVPPSAPPATPRGPETPTYTNEHPAST